MKNPFYGMLGMFAVFKVFGTFLVIYLIMFLAVIALAYIFCAVTQRSVDGKTVRICALTAIIPAVIFTAVIAFVLSKIPMLI